MVLGVLFQWLLISGHLPFSHFVSIHADAHAGLSVSIGMQPSDPKRDLHAQVVVRMRRPDFQTGVIFPQWGANAYGDDDPNWQIGLKDIQEQTGAQWIELPITLSQASITSTTVFTTAQTPTPDAVAAGIRRAHALHYHVFVVPLLSVEGVGIYSWSGTIKFSNLQDTQAWFNSYWQAISPYVAASAQAGADELAIATECENLQTAPSYLWKQLIERVHAVFPGKLTYDMNWSSLYMQSYPSWFHNPYLSTIGVSEYIPLTNVQERLDPRGLPGLWKDNVGQLLDVLSKQLGKPVLISEIGYRDTIDALYHPWQRDASELTQPADPEEQAAAYNAALSNAIVDPHISGIFFWAWSVPVFEPNWKPAAKILYKWYTSYLA
jgi:hypothetical protein